LGAAAKASSSESTEELLEEVVGVEVEVLVGAAALGTVELKPAQIIEASAVTMRVLERAGAVRVKPLPDRIHPELIVEFAALGILQDLVGRGGFFEARLGAGVIGVGVGVIFLGDLPVCFLYRARVRVLWDAEHLVEISHRLAPHVSSCYLATTTCAVRSSAPSSAKRKPSRSI